MSEESKKVLGIRHLPIFPLPLVLMPFEILPLHIFEDRYKKMLEDIAVSKNMFGVSLLEPAEQGPDRPAAGSTGCVAEIRESHHLEDGRSNILTTGVIRYRIENYIASPDPYLVAEVEFFEDVDEPEAEIEPLADAVFSLFKRVAKAAHKISGQQGEFPEIPQAEPEQLSFLVSAAFSLDNEIKYRMLEMRKTSERLSHLKDVLSRSVEQVEETAKINKVSRTNGHVKKKIDID
ncbi:MAG TPA: LON peptidase substrate-binding domain-containing protein [Aridibacter sp.]|nr:LON peptidase substrate-binding domain-containing protein [Aridibacter sp.]